MQPVQALRRCIMGVRRLNQLDVQLLLEPYSVLYECEGRKRVTRRGFGDITVRLNFWGNDGGRTAFAMTPYVKFPTSQKGINNRGVEGGLVLPLAVELPSAFYLGLTTRFDARSSSIASPLATTSSGISSVTLSSSVP